MAEELIDAKDRRRVAVMSFMGIVAEPSRHLREELASIGILAAEIMMAAAHVRDGDGLDETDRKVLERSAALFRSFAERIRFIQSGGQGMTPHAMLSTGTSNEVVLPDEAAADPSEIASFYDILATKLESLASTPGVAEAEEIYSRFRLIAERARAGAGSSGHELPSPSTPSF